MCWTVANHQRAINTFWMHFYGADRKHPPSMTNDLRDSITFPLAPPPGGVINCIMNIFDHNKKY